jgi:gliding motility-associated-like protein
MGWNVETYVLTIYDRWGKKIFYTKNYADGWNGSIKENNEPAPIGIYIYTLQLKDIFNKTREYTGFISIVN